MTTDGAYKIDSGYVGFNYNGDDVWDQAWRADGNGGWETSVDGQHWRASDNPYPEIFAWEMTHRD